MRRSLMTEGAEVDPYEMNTLYDYVEAMMHSHWPAHEIALSLLQLGYRPTDSTYANADWLLRLKADLWDEAYAKGSLHGVGPLFEPNPYKPKPETTLEGEPG
jgi:hypothetical protein